VVIMGDGLRPIGKPLEIATVPYDCARATFLSRPSLDALRTCSSSLVELFGAV
jgi:hypothetical protein